MCIHLPFINFKDAALGTWYETVSVPTNMFAANLYSMLNLQHAAQLGTAIGLCKQQD